ncbi:MAG TPA: LuxR C-terminal-related transcriptional regulator [Phycisphaerales bacterium]|nr:LuxR C-terminal-related transcriptional regulator [Phycisphaerales bacterium]
MIVTPLSRPMGPDDFAPFDGIEGLCALARDEKMVQLWCNQEYAALHNTTASAMIGRSLFDVLPQAHAEERLRLMQPTLDTGVVSEYYQLWRGARWLTRCFPLKESVFAKRGLFVILARLAPETHPDDTDTRPMVVSPEYGELGVLSRRELEVLYLLARGYDAPEIGKRLFRSTHTINDHIKAIHQKLNIDSRAAVVKLAVARGLLGFDQAEWEALAAHQKPVRE